MSKSGKVARAKVTITATREKRERALSRGLESIDLLSLKYFNPLSLSLSVPHAPAAESPCPDLPRALSPAVYSQIHSIL